MVTFQVFSLLLDPFRNEIINAAFDITRRILLQTRDDQILLINDASVIQSLFAVEDLHQR